MPFHVIDLSTNKPVEDSEGKQFVYETGQEAAAAAKQFIQERKPLKFKAKAILNKEWQTRELERLGDGTYANLPWEGFAYDPQKYRNEYEYNWGIRSSTDETRHHYAHISKKYPGNVAFTENPVKGARDIQTTMRPGRYLRQFWGHYLSNESIRELAAMVTVASGEYSLRFANTPDEIEEVYLKGPGSCMSHIADEYQSTVNHKPYHPVRIYGAGDLAVAYLVQTLPAIEDEPAAEEIIARALCWPSKGICGRLYGDQTKLRTALQKEGYIEEWYFKGAKLLRVLHKGKNNNYIVPYLDGGNRRVRDNGKFLIIDDNGKIDCEVTGGVSSLNIVRCYECGDEVDFNEATSVYSDRYCPSCADEYLFTCGYSGDRGRNEDGVEVIGPYGAVLYLESFIDRNTFVCAGDGNRYATNMEDRSRRNGNDRYSRVWSLANPVVIEPAIEPPIQTEMFSLAVNQSEFRAEPVSDIGQRVERYCDCPLCLSMPVADRLPLEATI